MKRGLTACAVLAILLTGASGVAIISRHPNRDAAVPAARAPLGAPPLAIAARRQTAASQRLLGAPPSRRQTIAPATPTTGNTPAGAHGHAGGRRSQERAVAAARADNAQGPLAAGAPSSTPTPKPTPKGHRAASAPSATPTPTPKGRHTIGAPARTAPTPRATPTPSPKATPKPGAWRRPYSWLAQTTLLTIYGRAFSTAPILGRLGMDDNFAQLEWQLQPYAHGIKANNGGTDPRIAVHLIYAMAVPCGATGNCLYYLDDAGVDIVKTYIKEAARRHWLVILDDQLGRSDPVTEMRRIIAKGYLKYDNVEVALDPEFRAQPYQPTPGIPVGAVSADELNAAGAMLNAYAARLDLLHRKIMMVHQFQVGMIANRQTLRQDLFYVDTVVVADGFGPPALKTQIYDELLGPDVSPAVHWRGIKLFPFNPYEGAGHGDFPEMTWPQVFGRAPMVGPDGNTYVMRPMPNVVVIA